MVPLRITRLGDDMLVLLGTVRVIVSAGKRPEQGTPGLPRRVRRRQQSLGGIVAQPRHLEA